MTSTVQPGQARARDAADQPRRPGRPRSEEAERAIMDATLDLLAAQGIGGVTIEAVAAKSGVAKTTVYRRWPNKHELILDAVARLKGPIPQAKGLSVREDLVDLLARASQHAGHGPRCDRVMPRISIEADQYPELMEHCRERIILPRRRVYIEVLERGVAEGIVRPDADLALAVEMLVCPVMMSRTIRGKKTDAPDIAFIVDTVLSGLAPS